MEPRSVLILLQALPTSAPEVTHPFRVTVRYFDWQKKEVDSFHCFNSGEAAEIMAHLNKQKNDMRYTWESVELLHVTLSESGMNHVGRTLVKWTNTITIETAEKLG